MPPRACPSHVDPQCFGNIENDRMSGDDLKDQLILALQVAGSQTDAKRVYEEWRAGILRDGRYSVHPKTFSAGERVGRLRFRARYLSQLTEDLRSDAGLGVDETDVEPLVSWMVGEPSPMEDTSARFLFDRFVADRRIETQTGWYFRTTPPSATPFSDSPACLPWRLGLQYVTTGSEYVGFDVDPSHLGTPRTPVFVDVSWDLHAYWRPNGMTYPLTDTPGTCSSEGLEELVAAPATFRGVKLPIAHVRAA
jgi:hypothetical protein